MKFFEHWFDIKRMISILYWRIRYEVIQAGFSSTSLLFTCAIHCANRVVRPYWPIQRPAATAARATVAEGAAATRRPNRLVPGRARCTDSRSFHLSRSEEHTSE